MEKTLTGLGPYSLLECELNSLVHIRVLALGSSNVIVLQTIHQMIVDAEKGFYLAFEII